MNLFFNKIIASKYKSPAQKIRVLTEDWVDNEIFCPNCGTNIVNYENNRPVADFYCPKCNEDFELKSKQNSVGIKIVDGAYKTMIERLSSSHNPNFFFLNYNPIKLEVLNFLVIPKHFFIPNIIEKRKPLTANAKRAGWIGCNILLQNVPQSGKIFYIKHGREEEKNKIIDTWQKTLFLRDEKEISVKGWLLDVMRCADRLDKKEFLLDEMYAFVNELKQLHPENKHVKDKIRQQLQILRDKGYLDFVSRGCYHLI
ncbi:MAG: DpnI domain-containing protein [Candidatus Kuenenbacteria bacterium]